MSLSNAPNTGGWPGCNGHLAVPSSVQARLSKTAFLNSSVGWRVPFVALCMAGRACTPEPAIVQQRRPGDLVQRRRHDVKQLLGAHMARRLQLIRARLESPPAQPRVGWFGRADVVVLPTRSGASQRTSGKQGAHAVADGNLWSAPDFVAGLVAGAAPPHDLGFPLGQGPEGVAGHDHVKLLRPPVQHQPSRICTPHEFVVIITCDAAPLRLTMVEHTARAQPLSSSRSRSSVQVQVHDCTHACATMLLMPAAAAAAATGCAYVIWQRPAQQSSCRTCDLAVLVHKVRKVWEHQVQEAVLAVVPEQGDGAAVVVLLCNLLSGIRIWQHDRQV